MGLMVFQREELVDGVQRTRVETIMLCGSLQRVTAIEMTRVSFKGIV